jgi:hypothetical protein
VRDLIATVARDNPSCGAERIRGELLKLGIVVSRRSVRRHRPGIWAADLLGLQTFGFRTLYVLPFVARNRQELVHLNVTAHPIAAGCGPTNHRRWPR